MDLGTDNRFATLEETAWRKTSLPDLNPRMTENSLTE